MTCALAYVCSSCTVKTSNQLFDLTGIESHDYHALCINWLINIVYNGGRRHAYITCLCVNSIARTSSHWHCLPVLLHITSLTTFSWQEHQCVLMDLQRFLILCFSRSLTYSESACQSRNRMRYPMTVHKLNGTSVNFTVCLTCNVYFQRSSQ